MIFSIDKVWNRILGDEKKQGSLLIAPTKLVHVGVWHQNHDVMSRSKSSTRNLISVNRIEVGQNDPSDLREQLPHFQQGCQWSEKNLPNGGAILMIVASLRTTVSPAPPLPGLLMNPDAALRHASLSRSARSRARFFWGVVCRRHSDFPPVCQY